MPVHAHTCAHALSPLGPLVTPLWVPNPTFTSRGEPRPPAHEPAHSPSCVAPTQALPTPQLSHLLPLVPYRLLKVLSLERRLGDTGWYDVLDPPVKHMRRGCHRRKGDLAQSGACGSDLRGVLQDSLPPDSGLCLCRGLFPHQDSSLGSRIR